MSLCQRCGSLFPVPEKLRGRQLYDQNDVAVTDRQRDSAKLRVTIRGGHELVNVAWSNSNTRLEVHCTCGKAVEAKHCQHLWASFLELDRLKAIRTMPTRGNVELAFVEPPPPQIQPGKQSSENAAAIAAAGVAKAAGKSSKPNMASTPATASKPVAPSKPASTNESAASGKARLTPDSVRDTSRAKSPTGRETAVVRDAESSRAAVNPRTVSPSDRSRDIVTRDDRFGVNSLVASTKAEQEAKLQAFLRGSSVNSSWFTPPANLWRSRFDRLERHVAVRESSPAERKPLEQRADLLRLVYMLDITESANQRQPVIFFYQRHRAAPTANWGPFQPVGMDRSSLERWEDPADRNLLPLLLGTDLPTVDPSYDSDYSSISRRTVSRRFGASLPAMLATLLLPKLCETGRLLGLLTVRRPELFASARPLTWDAEEPYRMVLRIKPDNSAHCWDMRAELRRGETHLAAHHATLISDLGLAVHADRIINIANDESARLCRALGVEPVRVPFTEGPQFMLECLRYPQLASHLPPELQWEQEDIAPVCQVMIKLPAANRTRKAMMTVSLHCRYDEKTYLPGYGHSVFASPHERKVLRRDLNREEELATELETHPDFEESVRSTLENPWSYQCDPRSIERITSAALRLGWQVIADGQLVRRSTGTTLQVKSEIDWFELNATLNFEGESVELPEVLAAIRRGEQYVTLGDGTTGMLPAEWLAKFGPIAELAERGDDTEGLKFLPSQALLLDSLLESNAANQVGIDERFAEWRENLRSFRGFAPQAAPNGFQGNLRTYQEAGLGWMHGLRELSLGGCLADDMGLGKTVQVLALLESRRQSMADKPDEHLPSLVVAPKSLVFNWAEEAKRFAPNLRVLRFTGNERVFVRDQLKQYDLVLTTYGTLRRDVPTLKEIQFDYAILDEAQAIKNASSQSAKSCRLIRARHRLAMTGTPIENHLGELWSLFEFINPGMLGMSSAFQRLAKSARGAGEQVADEGENPDIHGNSPSTLAETKGTANAGGGVRSTLALALRPFILRRTKQQVLTELPERTEQTLFCEMDSKQRRLYDELRSHYRTALLKTVKSRGMAKSKIHVLEALLRLRQVACHPALVDSQYTEVESAKLEALMEKLSEIISENHKALVFSQFTSLLALVRGRLDSEGYAYEYLDGQTSDRQARVERFQKDPRIPLFLISLKAGGQGLNLTSADYVFILDPCWNPAVEAQAVDRAYRMGQTRHVFAYRLICRDTIEEKILEMQAAKRAVADAILTEDNSVLRDLTAEDLERLLS
ncbi:MAG: SNF2-related protein [Planctomycetota bacterium]